MASRLQCLPCFTLKTTFELLLMNRACLPLSSSFLLPFRVESKPAFSHELNRYLVNISGMLGTLQLHDLPPSCDCSAKKISS
ncbi:hypothetical protein DY000_02015271 [Brassica cretica]|uniref:Secreted protein n=1 Tax=Brassica cretica TaxID=69181 RepID=A0ABQ7D6Y1_BRACR|nr:hypothetical protein DY000_02015271 [Brassica cretica]